MTRTFRELAIAYLEGLDTGQGPTLEELVRSDPQYADQLVEFAMSVRAMGSAEKQVEMLPPVNEETRQWIRQRLTELSDYSLPTAATLGTYVRECREAQSLSRRDLAQAIGHVEQVIEDLESDALLPTRLPDRAWLRLKETLGMPTARLWELIVQAMEPGAVRSPGMALPRMDRSVEPEDREAFLSASVPGLDEEDARRLEEIRATLSENAPHNASSA